MDTIDPHDEFETWIKQSEQTLAEIAKEQPKQEVQPLRTSFFNNFPSEVDYEETDEASEPVASDDWNEIYRRALECDFSQDPDIITEERKEGFSNLVRGNKQITKGDITYFDKPQYAFGMGQDQGGEEGDGVRVTKNFNQGTDLEQVDDLAKRIEMLERKAHNADVMKRKGERDKLSEELKSLRNEIRSLSEKMQSQADKDVT